MLRIFTSRDAEFIGPQDPLLREVWVVNLNVKRLEVTWKRSTEAEADFYSRL